MQKYSSKNMRYLPTNLKEISTYRSELMGRSILWIMMLHFTFNQIAPLGFVAQYGFAGVEIFLFVSGLGLSILLKEIKTLGISIRKDYFVYFRPITFLELLPACHYSTMTFYLISFDIRQLDFGLEESIGNGISPH